MLLEVNPLEFASSDAKCSAFGRMILEISAGKKNLGSEKTMFPYL